MAVEQMALPEEPSTPWDGIAAGDTVRFPKSVHNANTYYMVLSADQWYLSVAVLNMHKSPEFRLGADQVRDLGIVKVK